MAEPEILTVGLLLKRAYQSSKAAVDAALAPRGSSLSQWVVLEQIASRPDVSARALARVTYQTEQALGRLAMRLADRGLIERCSGPANVVGHRLTPEGRRLLAEATPVVHDVLSRELGVLGSGELGALRRLLESVAGRGEDHS
ncbi:MarR family winged helix-turn-helix transcriptional regulator [Amycolatopsis acidicola]|uniref:MarR family winged helix-turn-helix transcriptional regulator n=1 Tax=Amycolatopsis acidicola TaxID=2596893 RepID=UPI00140B5B93|nr:MarR family winged helix-turn-helix transcriptional regulator [Amycolatopsis acidicola]